MDSWIVIGLMAGVMTTTGFLPQLIKGFRTKRMDDVSMLMPLILIVGMSLWLIYGTILDDLPIILWNAVGIVINLGIVVLKLRYSGHLRSEKAEGGTT